MVTLSPENMNITTFAIKSNPSETLTSSFVEWPYIWGSQQGIKIVGRPKIVQNDSKWAFNVGLRHVNENIYR